MCLPLRIEGEGTAGGVDRQRRGPGGIDADADDTLGGEAGPGGGFVECPAHGHLEPDEVVAGMLPRQVDVVGIEPDALIARRVGADMCARDAAVARVDDDGADGVGAEVEAEGEGVPHGRGPWTLVVQAVTRLSRSPAPRSCSSAPSNAGQSSPDCNACPGEPHRLAPSDGWLTIGPRVTRQAPPMTLDDVARRCLDAPSRALNDAPSVRPATRSRSSRPSPTSTTSPTNTPGRSLAGGRACSACSSRTSRTRSSSTSTTPRGRGPHAGLRSRRRQHRLRPRASRVEHPAHARAPPRRDRRHRV
jgi:hypothetical protein